MDGSLDSLEGFLDKLVLPKYLLESLDKFLGLFLEMPQFGFLRGI